jgi:hypothetical protein
MATLALRPAYPVRPQSGSKRERKHRGRDAPRTLWRTIGVTAGAIALTFFSVSAPMIGDPSGRLFALDASPTISIAAAFGDAWPGQVFEFTPALLGPAITAEMLTLADEDPILIMPEFVVHAVPPSADDGETSPRG